MPESFDVIDEKDQVVGTRPGRECVELGLLHRAVVIFLFNAWGDVFVQKRAKDTQYYPGFWSASCTGHVSAGETYLEAAKREAREELGLDLDPLEVGRFISPKWRVPAGVEWESIAVFEATAGGTAMVLSDESEEGKFVSVTEFNRMLRSEPALLTPDTILSAKYSKKLK